MKKILVVDSRPIVRRGLEGILAARRDLQLCGECDDARSALSLAVKLSPQLIILDLPPPDMSGFDFIAALRARCPKTQLLAFTNLDEQLFGERVLRAGARGFLPKTATPAQVLEAIDTVLHDEPYLPSHIMSRIVQRYTGAKPSVHQAPIDRLTDRELEVFELLSQGLPVRQIAQRLGVGIKTVQTHRDNARVKLGLGSAAAMLHFAIQWACGPGPSVSDASGGRPAAVRARLPDTSRRS